MRIKSNFKDYYDYCLNTIGIDEKAFYLRVTKTFIYKTFDTAPHSRLVKTEESIETIISLLEPGKQYSVFAMVGEKEYRGAYLNGKFYFGHSYLKLLNEKWHKYKIEDVIKDRRDKEEPVIVFLNGYKIINPCLGKFNFSTALTPEECYFAITNFILKSGINEETRELTDKEKILQHGFDLKTSFRGK